MINAPAEMNFVDTNGVRLAYEIFGAGEPLLMLNGGPGFSHAYLLETLPLADTARLVFYDQRGTGRSSQVAPAGYTVAANVEDLEGLRQALGLGSCGVFGHSWGGMLAQAYAVRYPRNVSRLILADTFSRMDDLNQALARMRAAVPPETEAVYQHWERAGLYAPGRDGYPVPYQEALAVAYEPVSMTVAPPPALQNAFAQLSPDVYRAMWGDQTEFEVTGTLSEFDVWDRLPGLVMPTLILLGASDMPTVAMAQAMVNQLRNGRLEIFEQSRHYPFLEEPSRFFAVVRAFLHETA